MIYSEVIKAIFSFIWKFKTLFLLVGLIATLYFGYKYVNSLKAELKDSNEIAKVAIEQHNKVINNYNKTNEELKLNEEVKDTLEKENNTLKNKLETEARKRGKNEDWGNTPIPDSIRLLLQQRPQELQ